MTSGRWQEEEPVKTSYRHGNVWHAPFGTTALALALLGGSSIAGLGVASAQLGSPPPTVEEGTITRSDPHSTQLRLSETQKSAIADAVRRENKAAEPSVSFVASVGAPVPPVIELYMLPDKVLAEVPGAKRVKYTVMKNQLVLVDPTTMRVVDIIQQ
jgi:Protein of unknown function (DUF1236)